MSNYTKATNFAIKDGLVTTDPAKVIKGTEIDNEYNAISSAIATKADVNSPSLTGTPTAPTATSGSNTTQIATTAFVQAALPTLGTIATQDSDDVTITGGSITGITDLTVADGGTGASSITANSVILGNGSSALSGNLVAPGTSGNVLKSNGTTWTSAAESESGIGIGQTWQNMTSSRSFGSSYTNSTSKSIMVAITSTAGSGTTMAATVGGVLVQTNGVHAATELNTLTFIVPPSTSYSVASTETLNNWAELR